MSKFLASPKTQRPLKFVEGKVVVEDKKSEFYFIREGVVIFDNSAAEKSEVKSKLTSLLEKARTDGCIAAIEDQPDLRDYLLDSERLKYIDLLDLKPTSTVLEIGASMGQHTRIIAQRCEHLEALEVVFEQAAFAKLWCEQSGQINVNVSSGGSEGYLPYKENSFDALFINYVLEWSASRSKLHPVDYHYQLLSECLRVLRPGGTIFLSTKNRFGIGLLLGNVDEHLNFRFGNALPRWLGSILSKVIKRSETGYLHSRGAIEQLFQKAGFVDLRPFLLLPDARKPKIVESFDKAGLEKICKQNYWGHASKREKVFSKLPYFIQKHVAPSHVYIASKPRVS